MNVSGLKRIKSALEKVLKRYPPRRRIENDPIGFPRRFFESGRSLQEIEAAAFLSAMPAYGSAAQFIKITDSILESFNDDLLSLGSCDRIPKGFPYYRLSTADEIFAFCKAVSLVSKSCGSLKEAFLEGYNQPEGDIRHGAAGLRSKLVETIEKAGVTISHGLNHLLPNPLGGGCAKRWMMFLRWMARPDDGVDMGLWAEVSPAELVIPLDRHISQISRNLGFTTRLSDDWKTAVEITAFLRKLSPDDPLRYDFALCHLGISKNCTHGKTSQPCANCLLRNLCRKNPGS